MYEAALDGFVSAVFFISSINAALLAAILLFNHRLKNKANRALAFALIGVSIILLYESIYALGLEREFVFLSFIPFYVISTIPIGVYYFTVYFLRPQRQFGNRDWWILLPIGLEILVELSYLPVFWKLDSPEQFFAADMVLTKLSEAIGLTVSFILLPRSLQKVRQYQKQLADHFSTIPQNSIRWLQFFIYALIAISLFWLVSFLQGLFGVDDELTFSVVNLGFSFLLFGLGYTMILGASIFQSIPLDDNRSNDATKAKKLSKKADKYHEELLLLMEQEKLFLNSDLQLLDLYQRLDISASYLSQIINEKEGKSFFEFVNHYRVETVKEHLVCEDYSHYSVMGIALECGFNTKSTFYSVFKQFTGATPSAYQKAHRITQKES